MAGCGHLPNQYEHERHFPLLMRILNFGNGLNGCSFLCGPYPLPVHLGLHELILGRALDQDYLTSGSEY
jgi:hypothetical protein